MNQKKNVVVALISVLITLVVCLAIMAAGLFVFNNKYNELKGDLEETKEKLSDEKEYIASLNQYNMNKDGYIQILDDLARESGKTLDEVKEEFDLPEDMTGDTYVVAAECYIPVEKYFQMQGMSADMIPMYAEMMGIEEVDENMPYGEFAQLMNEAAKKQEQESAEEETAPADEIADTVEEAAAE